MFQVDFGGAIGTRSIRVSDSAAGTDGIFAGKQRTLFADVKEDEPTPVPDIAAEEVSKDDPDWQTVYEDFLCNDPQFGSTSDCHSPSYMEDPLHELGLYNSAEDVSA